MRIVIACSFGVAIALLSLVAQRVLLSHLDTPLVSLVGSLLFTSGMYSIAWVAWPVLGLAYVAPAVANGLFGAVAFLITDAIVSAQQHKQA
jgi:hypothetical protein